MRWAAVLLLAAACAAPPLLPSEPEPVGQRGGQPEYMSEYDVLLSDGLTVRCVQLSTGTGMALSCDWDDKR